MNPIASQTLKSKYTSMLDLIQTPLPNGPVEKKPLYPGTITFLEDILKRAYEAQTEYETICQSSSLKGSFQRLSSQQKGQFGNNSAFTSFSTVVKPVETPTTTTHCLIEHEIGQKDVNSDNYQAYIQQVHSHLRRFLSTVNTDDDIVFNASPKTRRRGSQYSAKNFRGSTFRGVSKNKSKWQVMITLNHVKEYYGGFNDPEVAAKDYDV